MRKKRGVTEQMVERERVEKSIKEALDLHYRLEQSLRREEKICANCRFWRDSKQLEISVTFDGVRSAYTKGGYGYCHRFPPARDGGFTRTCKTAYCGEFQPKDG